MKEEFLMNETPDNAQFAKAKKEGIDLVFAIGSGKGGVGKSSVTALLAVALQRQGFKVGILDADLTGPSIPKLLGVDGMPKAASSGLIPPASPRFGIRVMSINLLLDDPYKPVIWRGPLITNVIKQFWDDVTWGEVDYLLVDLPPGTSDAPLTVMQMLPLDGFLAVTSPQALSAMVVLKAVNMANMLSVPVLGALENMSYAICPHCHQIWEPFGLSHVEELREHGVSILAKLPIDPSIAKLGDEGRLEEYEDTEVLQTLLTTLPKKMA
jgi:Mrp family chromosome partitioning ATPase